MRYFQQQILFARCRYGALQSYSSQTTMVPIVVKLNLFLLMMQVLNQDETPLLYSLVFGEGVVNDAASVVLFNAIQSFDLTHTNLRIALQFIGNFFYLFFTSTMLGVVVSLSLSLSLDLNLSHNSNTLFFLICTS